MSKRIEKIVKKSPSVIDRWTEKGYSSEVIINGLWNHFSVTAKYENGTYTMSFWRSDNTWTHTV